MPKPVTITSVLGLGRTAPAAHRARRRLLGLLGACESRAQNHCRQARKSFHF
jgi:hypothetical protein